jgi:hypothetical protein
MLFLSIVHHYLAWHYSRAFVEIFHVWRNFLWFIAHFFSLKDLMLSWFSPWKRMVEGRGNTWDLEDLASFIIIGLISRIIGAILRTIIIVIGLVSLTITFVGGFIIYAFWVVAPAVLIGLLVAGFTLIFS